MNNTKTLVKSALFCALTLLFTLFIKVPSPLGYVNLGDAMVIISALFLPLPYAILTSALGSALADVLAGYLTYAPGTFVIKGLMALVIALIFSLFKKYKSVGAIIGSIAAEILMIGGYLFYEWVFLSYGSGALVSISYNAVQGVASMVVAIVIYFALSRVFKRKGW